MGNFTSGRSANSEGEGKGIRESWPGGLEVSWSDFQRRRHSPYKEPMGEEEVINGLIFGGLVVPDNVLELILSLVGEEDILNCNLVCRNWKDVITRKSYWKLWFDRRGWDWGLIPGHIKDKPESWIVFHAQVRHHLFTKNLIKNHSGVGDGRTEFRDWRIHANGGDKWKLEPSPKGCQALPPDRFFDNSTSAWVTSFGACSKWTMVDLWESGMTPPVMKTCLPFSLECSQMYTTRFDCGGVFNWTLRLLDRSEELITEFIDQLRLGPDVEWQTVSHPFGFKEEHVENMEELRKLVFMHEGKDDRFWKGHYGMKFSRSCVKIRLDTPEPAEKSEEDSAT